jgi:hypothetical protein
MNKAWFCLLLIIPVLLFNSSRIVGDHHYIKQRCEAFQYEISVPAHWERDEVTLEKKHIFVSYSNRTEIRVRAFITEEKDINQAIRTRRWNLRSIDPLLNNIIETGKIRIRKKERDDLLVFEYRSDNNKMLQRTMISKSGNMIYIVDCKSPLKNFYKNEKHFNIALSSFSILGEIETEGETGLPGEEDVSLKDRGESKGKINAKQRTDTRATKKSEDEFPELD